MAILAPSRAQILPIANPIPLEAPEITIVFPARGLLDLILFARSSSLYIINYIMMTNFQLKSKSIFFEHLTRYF
jgi:hypothetical protein